ncbi:DWNN domain-containing protein [Coniochaeta sp. 2T2.1]|nr:DWNN domain-containing protein [Coniochaeta sp. 2T2.1]
MASSVFFKFKSQKEPTRVEFDGTGISVFELKRDIIIKSGLGDGTDFDLAIYTDDGEEEYDDDTTIIPRSTTVIARRLPPMKPGAGRAARYVSGKMPVNAKNQARKEQASKAATTKAVSNGLAEMSSAQTEEEKMAAMFQAQTAQWSAQQEEMAHQQPVFKPGMGKKPQNVPDHDPPQGYICYRCGEKGHWIQLCPTNDNPEFDNRPRVKRTTGIPRSFLKTVDKATALAQHGDGGDDSKTPSGIMVNAEGEFVIAEPDKASWEQFQAKAKSGAKKAAPEEGNKEVRELGLECPIDKRMFIDPMKTPCCEKTYCNDCITNALIESDFICPACSTEGVLIDDLKPDDEAASKIKDYLSEKENKGKEGSKSPATKAAATPKSPVKGEDQDKEDQTKEKAGSKSPRAAAATTGPSPKSPKSDTVQTGGSPQSKPSASATPATEASSVVAATNPKKRPAEETAENPKIPKAPKAMQQQKVQQQNMMDNMMGMPGMPGMNMPGMPMMPGFMPGMPGMPGMGGMPNMPMGIMNPMMNMMGPGFMPGMGMGMNGMPNFNGMNGMPPMGMGMNGMHNGPMNGGMPGGPNMQGMNGGMNGPMNGGQMNGPGGYGNQARNHNQNQFQHQQHQQQQHQQQQQQLHGPGYRNFSHQPADDGEDAYFRKPVNPHRHQNKMRRARPSDYREL